MKLLARFCSLCLLCASTLVPPAHADGLKTGAPAPPLHHTRLLQAPAGAKADWQALRGKTVVLEFWATWCAPCIGEIPILNRLAASTDPAKVQIISVDDEDPALVASFLKKKPISGWVLLDTSGGIFKKYGVDARPATIVIGPDGRIVSTTVHPEQLHADALTALAEGRPAELAGKVDAKTQAELDAGTEKAFDEQAGRTGNAPARRLFEISIEPGDATKDTHVMMHGSNTYDIMDAGVLTLLTFAAHFPAAQIEAHDVGEKPVYRLHVFAPGVDEKTLNDEVTMAIASAAGLKIERHTQEEDVYLLKAAKGGTPAFQVGDGKTRGMGFYGGPKVGLQLLHGNTAQLADALETVLVKPVIDDSGVPGTADAVLKIPPHDPAAAKDALESQLGMTLVPARRPVERMIVTPLPKSDAAPAASVPARSE